MSGTARPARDEINDKLVWTLVRPSGMSAREFQDYLLEDLAPAAGELVADTTGVLVSIQEPNTFSGAIVRMGAEDRRVDAVLQVMSSGTYVPTIPVNSVLAAQCDHVQGWRVHESVIHDVSSPLEPGTPVALKQLLWINQRLDGTTPEHYDSNWYIHAGHLDGQEAESEETRRQREERRAAASAQGAIATGPFWYYQNRVREPITPTAWVVNGMSDYLSAEFLPAGPGERYNPGDGMGEASFDEWPPRLFQGYTYRVR